MDKPNRPLAAVLKLLAVIAVLCGAALMFLPPNTVAQAAPYIGLVICLAAGATVWGVGSLIAREEQAPAEVRSSLSRIEHHVIDVSSKVHELQVMSERASRAAPVTQAPAKDYSEYFRQITTHLDQLRELSLLTDSDRRARAHSDRHNRKTAMINELFALVASHQWPKAERLLITLQTEFPNDDEVAKGRSHLDHSRRLVEEETMQRSTALIEELVASASWERAWEAVLDLVEGFPTSRQAKDLHERVQTEYSTWCDINAQRLFEGIRVQIDLRNWRQAYKQAESLLEQFPNHRVAETLRNQINTLRDNAEIQERQEMEVRIQELMHDGQFPAAIELAEEVIRRFPDSPQAESLETLLPKIRELAQQEAEASGAPE
ncbi:MAG TPA: outer membrane protein assembly factor BamD [Tepidisphaeraceae bacterium]|nr:outer membrane protein assembly factor BamD [Tepidisphaeraceae bacterium]